MNCIILGAFGGEYELPDNCWGQNFLPQTKVLPIVNLVISHGGNNTTTETFYFGKPLIVMPLFTDQFDNAQRVHEKGFGIRLNPFRCTKEELAKSIDSLINNNDLLLKLKKISDRIKAEVKLGKVAELIEKVVIDSKK